MGEKKYCWQCGEENPSFARFCTACSASFGEDSDAVEVNANVEEDDKKGAKKDNAVSSKKGDPVMKNDENLAREAERIVNRMRQLRLEAPQEHVGSSEETGGEEHSQKTNHHFKTIGLIIGIIALIVIAVVIFFAYRAILFGPTETDMDDYSISEEESEGDFSQDLSTDDESILENAYANCSQYANPMIGNDLLYEPSDKYKGILLMTYRTSVLSDNSNGLLDVYDMWGCVATNLGISENEQQGVGEIAQIAVSGAMTVSLGDGSFYVLNEQRVFSPDEMDGYMETLYQQVAPNVLAAGAFNTDEDNPEMLSFIYFKQTADNA